MKQAKAPTPVTDFHAKKVEGAWNEALSRLQILCQELSPVEGAADEYFKLCEMVRHLQEEVPPLLMDAKRKAKAVERGEVT